MGPFELPSHQRSSLLEIALGLLLLGALTLLFPPVYPALRGRMNEFELELADQGVRLLVAIEGKQELAQRLAEDRSSDS